MIDSCSQLEKLFDRFYFQYMEINVVLITIYYLVKPEYWKFGKITAHPSNLLRVQTTGTIYCILLVVQRLYSYCEPSTDSSLLYTCNNNTCTTSTVLYEYCTSTGRLLLYCSTSAVADTFSQYFGKLRDQKSFYPYSYSIYR